MAHKKGAGQAKNAGQPSQRLGVKNMRNHTGSDYAAAAGTASSGENVGMGKDYTIFSKAEGVLNSTLHQNRENHVKRLDNEKKIHPKYLIRS